MITVQISNLSDDDALRYEAVEVTEDEDKTEQPTTPKVWTAYQKKLPKTFRQEVRDAHLESMKRRTLAELINRIAKDTEL